MLRTAPNFSNSTNRAPAHSFRYQTSANFAGFLLKKAHNSPLSFSGEEALTKRSRVPQLKDENVWLLLWADRENNRIEHF